MTNKEKKEYLEKYRYLCYEIKRLQAELEVWQSRAEKVTSYISGLPKGSAECGSEKTILKIIDMKQEISEHIREAVQVRNEIEIAIQTISNNTLQQVLKFRYIEMDTWEEIAEKMNYSYQWVCVLHGRALKELIVIDIDSVL